MPSGVELATAYVSLAVSTRGLGNQITRELGGVERAAGDTGRRAGSRLSAGFGIGMGGIRTAVMAGGAALALAGGAAVKFGVETVAANEQASIAFTTMLGSAQKAGDFLGKLQKFAATTPFEFPELQQAASSLISAGVNADKVIPIMRTLGDVTSGMGTGSEGVQRATVALQQMNAAGRITGEDLNQLRDAGIPVYDLLASATGKSKAEVVKLAQAGKLGQKELGQMMTALESGKGLERFSGLMDKQSQSLTGLWSTLQDTLGQGLANLLQPSLPLIKSALTGLTNFVGTALPALGSGLAVIFSGIGSAFGAVMRVIGPGIETVKTAFGAFFAALQEGDVTSDGLVGVFETVGDFLHRVLPQAIAIGQAAFSAIVGFIAAQVIPRVMGIVDAVRSFVSVALPIVVGFVSGMIARITPLMPTIRGIFGIIGQIITGALDLIKAVIERVTTVIGFVWRSWGQGIMDFISVVFGKVLGIIQSVLGVVQGVIRFFLAIFKGDWSGAWQAMKDTVGAAFEGVKRVVNLGLTLVGKAMALAWAGIKLAASAAWGGIVSAIGAAWNGLTGALSGPIDAALGFIQRNLIDPVNSMLSALGITWQIGRIWHPGTSYNAPRTRSARNNAFDTGGWTGPGAKMQPAGVVHADEFVLRKEATNRLRAKFGLGFLDHMNRTGNVPGYAEGGLVGGLWERLKGVGSDVAGFFAGPDSVLRRLVSSILGGLANNPMAHMVGAVAQKAFGLIAGKLKDSLFGGGAGGINAAAMQFGSVRLDTDTAARIQRARLASGLPMTIIQGSWSHNPLSMGTHAGSGAADARTTNWGAGVAALRAQGLLAMFRDWAGNQHIHMLNPFVSGLSPQARAQVRRARANGGVFANGGLVPTLYDQGGLLQPGLTLVENRTGRPEAVLPLDATAGDTYLDVRLDVRDLEDIRTVEEFIRMARSRARQRVGTAALA